MALNDRECVNEQYATDHDLRTRLETHQRFTVGDDLETLVDRALDLRGDEAILDVGTGPGDFPGRLAFSHRAKIIGLDASSKMVEVARAAHPKIEFLEGDVCALPFADQSFDRVTARHMLYHVPDLELAIAECRRVLKPNGLFLALTNADGNMADYWQAVREGLEGHGIANDPLFQSFAQLGPVNAYAHGRLHQLIEQAFGQASLALSSAVLTFPDASGPIAYFDSCRTLYGIDQTNWQRAHAAALEAFKARCAQGEWRVNKQVALIVART